MGTHTRSRRRQRFTGSLMKDGIPRIRLSVPVEKKKRGKCLKSLHPHPKLSLGLVPIGLLI